MANVTILGASYEDVPAVTLPKTGGGTAMFYDPEELHIPPDMVILSYGTSTWDDFISAYETNSVVYCRASSNSNPASGSKTRLAFMAYVNNETDPTSVEFQYYRSVNTHSSSQQGDQMYVYTLAKTGGWSVKVRESYSKVLTGPGLTSSYANSAITLKVSIASVTLLSSGWSNSEQTVNVSGLTTSDKVIVMPAPNSAIEWASSNVMCTGQGSGNLTFTCGTAPQSDLTANVLIGV